MRTLVVTVAFLLVSLTGSLDSQLDALAPLDVEKGKLDKLHKVDNVLDGIGTSSGELPRNVQDATLGSLLNAKTIQPGAYVEVSGTLCTMNYLYRSGGTYYIGTAAHCVGSVGDVARDVDGDAFGTVAAFGSQAAAKTDWALIRINPAYMSKASPAVRGHPDMPTGYTTSAETSHQDLVQVSGYGMGSDAVGQTRENRYSAIFFDDASEFELLPSTATPGDSGGPFVHLATGKAFGIVSRGLPIGEDTGPTVEGILPQMAAKGFAVSLVTV